MAWFMVMPAGAGGHVTGRMNALRPYDRDDNPQPPLPVARRIAFSFSSCRLPVYANMMSPEFALIGQTPYSCRTDFPSSATDHLMKKKDGGRYS
jgi:hypothetical protein